MIIEDLKEIKRRTEIVKSNIESSKTQNTYLIDKFQNELMNIITFFTKQRINWFQVKIDDVNIEVEATRALGAAFLKITLADFNNKNDYISVNVGCDNLIKEFHYGTYHPVECLGVKDFVLTDCTNGNEKIFQKLIDVLKIFLINNQKYLDNQLIKEKQYLIKQSNNSPTFQIKNEIYKLQNLQRMVNAYEKGKSLKITNPEEVVLLDFNKMSLEELQNYESNISILDLQKECIALNNCICARFSDIMKMEKSLFNFFNNISDFENLDDCNKDYRYVAEYKKNGFNFYVMAYSSYQMCIKILDEDDHLFGTMYYWYKSKAHSGKTGDFHVYLNLISYKAETNGLIPDTVQSFLEALECLETNWQEIMVDNIFEFLKTQCNDDLTKANVELTKLQTELNDIETQNELKHQSIMAML